MYEDDLNDCVGIPIRSIDRTNTDPKYLSSLIVEKIEKNNDFPYKLICSYDILDNIFEVGQFMDSKDVCLYELKSVNAG